MTCSILPQPSPPRATATDNALALAVDQAKVYAEAAHAPTTRRAYAVGWADFVAYCGAHGFDALPTKPQAIALYVAQLAQRGLKLASIRA
jgi:hypothetical protein